jgi:hypothetical protein
MSTVTINIEELYQQFKIRTELEAKIAELESKLVEAVPKKAKKPKDPNALVKEKKGGLPPEELAERRKQNGLRLAAANKLKREAKKESEKLDAEWLAAERAQKFETGSESGDNTPSENGSELD